MPSTWNEIAQIRTGAPSYFGGLTTVPLFRDGAATEPGYVLLEAAIASGVARITEVDAHGSVPELRFENLGDKPVLLLDGEALAGAKQNRIVNQTILAPARQVIVVPVSCVERGRWHAQTSDFRPSEHLLYAKARADKASRLSQSGIWAEIAAKSGRMGVNSPTEAMDAIYDSRAVSMGAYLRAFGWMEGQTGVLFAIGPQTIGIDLLDHPSTLCAMLPKLLRSYALDALEAPESPALTVTQAIEFLERLSKAQALVRRAIGMGEDYRLKGEGLSGAALRAEHRFIHLCAFTTEDTSDPSGVHTRMTRPAHRRTH
jgi:hypothetical protein